MTVADNSMTRVRHTRGEYVYPCMRCVTAWDGAPLAANRAWTAFTGLVPRRFRGEGWSAVLRTADRERFDHTRDEAAQLGLPFDLDLPLRRLDGVYRWCQVHGEPAEGDAASAPQWTIWFVDVDDQKSRQASLELALRRRDESLAEFAHDVRNPLQTMRHALFAIRLSGTPSTASPELLAVLERQVEVLSRRTEQHLASWQAPASSEPQAPMREGGISNPVP